MEPSGFQSSLPPVPPSVACREGINGLHITLPPPIWSRSSSLHSLITIILGVLGFAVGFLLAARLVAEFQALESIISYVGFAGMFITMRVTDFFRAWHHARLHSVHLTLTPSMVEISHRDYQHTVYLSEVSPHSGDAVALWSTDNAAARSRLHSQPDAVRDWTRQVLQAWLQRHLLRQGSRSEVPELLHQVSAEAQQQP